MSVETKYVWLFRKTFNCYLRDYEECNRGESEDTSDSLLDNTQRVPFQIYFEDFAEIQGGLLF